MTASLAYIRSAVVGSLHKLTYSTMIHTHPTLLPDCRIRSIVGGVWKIGAGVGCRSLSSFNS